MARPGSGFVSDERETPWDAHDARSSGKVGCGIRSFRRPLIGPASRLCLSLPVHSVDLRRLPAFARPQV